MAKPDIALARWADDPGAELLVPSSGLRDDGFQPGTPAVPGYVNELFKQSYLWAAFFDPLFTSGGGFTAPVDEDVAVSGTGRHTHDDQTANVSPIAGGGSGWVWDATNGYLSSTGAGSWSVGIPTIEGWRIKSVTFEVYGDGAADLTGSVTRRPKNATPDVPVTFSLSDQAAAYVDVPVMIPTWVIADGDSVWVVLTASASGLRVGELRVVYDFPTA